MKLIDQFKGREATPFIQFIKYGIAGGLATGVHISIFYVCALTIFPAIGADDWIVRLFGVTPAEISDAVRADNATYATIVGFIVSNAVCYVINILWVFKPGRHHWFIELSLFYAVSGIAMLVGTTVMNWLIRAYGIQTTIAFGANLVSAVMINYVMRKFVIFKG